MAAQGKAAASGKSKAKAAGALRSWSAVAPPLADWIIEAVSHYGFDRMTPVQASTIPLFNGNKDVVVEAVTGSGKTLAFLIPIIERLLRVEEPIKRHHVGAIIISPTRELATQIHQVLLSLLAFHPPSAALLSAGENGPDEAAILPSAFKIIPQLLLGGQGSPALDLSTFLVKSPNLLIATPGRLLELLSSSHVHCPQSSFEVLVLDEADRLLDLGFKNDLQRILQRLPKQRRTGLFSASVSEAVDQLVRVGLRNPVRIAVKVRSRDGNEEQKVPARFVTTPQHLLTCSLQMTYLTVRPIERMCTLLGLVSNIQPQPIKSIAYLSTGAAVDYFTPLLPNLLSLIQMPSAKAQTIMIFGLHGKQSPAHREKQFRGFVESRSPALLLTTDVAARGLDISSVDLTIQLDPPSDPKTFLHRAGRAGRAGRRGLAIVFLLPGQETDGYPLFLAVRKTPVSPLIEAGVHGVEETLEACSTIAEKSISKLRSVVLGDRAIHDKAQRAFVSWVQSYAKHAASSIFRVANLPWSELAEAWALLKLPRMPELRRSLDGGETLDTTLGLSIDWTAYKYRDVLQERKRVTEQSSSTDLDREEARIKVQQSDGVAASHKRLKNLPWSNQLQRQEVSSARRAKRASVMRAKELSRMTESQRRDAEETERMLARVRAQQQSALP